MTSNRIAILDLGTNTFHLLVAEIEGGSFTVVVRKKIPVKLGQGNINQGFINQEAEERALAAIKQISRILAAHEINEIRAIATSAIRNAANGRELIQKIKSISDLEVTVIDGDVEAEYIYYGVRQAISLGDYPVLIMDIGGGSVEFILANQHTIFWKRSFEIGAQRLYNDFQQHDPVVQKDVLRLYNYFYDSLKSLFEVLQQYHPRTLIGCSGTFDTLSDIYCIQKGIAKNLNDTERPINLDAFYDIHKAIMTRNLSDRLDIPGMSPMRADLITMSSSLIHFILSNHKFESLRASSYSLKEGIISLEIEKMLIRELSA